MTIPTYDKFIEPIIRYLAAHPEGTAAKNVHEATSDMLGITVEERQRMLPSGVQPIYKNRAGWAHDRLKRAGLSGSPRRGFWQLTDKGLLYAKEKSAPLSDSDLAKLIDDFVGVRLRPEAESTTVVDSNRSEATNGPVSPDERMGQALDEIRSAVTTEILEALSTASPQFFETIVLDLLHKMGYGTSRADLQRVGRSGDAGIDGVISLDKLGLEKVYVQAKRWQNVIGRPEIHSFHGALAGQRANKGVFITTSAFSSHAVEFAQSVGNIVLVDGPKMAQLMIDHEVGVSSRTIKIPKLDTDYFDEESV